MNEVLETILATHSVVDDEGTTYPVHSQIPSADGERLQRLIRDARPQTTLEIGLAYAVSALYICEALAEVGGTTHHVVDPLQHGQGDGAALQYDAATWEDTYAWSPSTGWRGVGLSNLRRAGYQDLIQFHSEPSHLALPSLVRDGVQIDFAFIDGWHTFDYVLLDFFYIDMLLRPGGMVAFDDARYPAIMKILRYVLTNRQYEVVSDGPVVAGPRSKTYRALEALSRRSERLQKALAPETTERNIDLGLGDSRCVVLRKKSDDVLGDGTGGSRSWNHHRPF